MTTPTDGSTLVFGFKHVNEAGADQYLVDSTGMRKYSEWQSPPITYWGPTANNVEGRLVYRIPFAAPAARIRLSASSPTWDFFTEPGGSGRGASSLEVSRDGTTWVSLIDNLTPRRWGADWTFNDSLPSSVAGGTEVWVRMRFLVESAPNSSYTVAQFGRSTSAATANVFEVRADFANSSPGPSQAAIFGRAVAALVASPVSTAGSEAKPRRSTSGL